MKTGNKAEALLTTAKRISCCRLRAKPLESGWMLYCGKTGNITEPMYCALCADKKPISS